MTNIPGKAIAEITGESIAKIFKAKRYLPTNPPNEVTLYECTLLRDFGPFKKGDYFDNVKLSTELYIELWESEDDPNPTKIKLEDVQLSIKTFKTVEYFIKEL